MSPNAVCRIVLHGLAVLAAAGFLGAGHPLAAESPSLDRSIASGYVSQAQGLYDRGEDHAALVLLERSLEFYPRYSESLYLQAMILMKRQTTLHQAGSALEQALDSGTWSSTAPRQAQIELARVYVATRRFPAAQRLLQSLAADRGLAGTGSADLAELWARTLIGLGRLPEAEGLLNRALRRFPDAAALYVLAGDLLAERGKLRQAAELLDRGLGEMPESAPLLYARARVEPGREPRLALLERYFDARGDNPAAALLVLVDELAVIPGGGTAATDRTEWEARADRALDRFLALGGQLRVPLVDRLRDLLLSRSAAESIAERAEADRREARKGGGTAPPPPALSAVFGALLERVDRALEDYTGARIVDADGDGRYEELYEYENGRLARWVLDEDQDGLQSAVAAFASGQPRSLAFPWPEVAGGTVEYVYSRYPFLRQLVYQGRDSRRVYELVPFVYSFDALEPVRATAAGAASSVEHPLGHRLRLRNVPGESEARQRASRMVEYRVPAGSSEVGAAEKAYSFLNGQTIRIDQDPDRDGRYRHQVFYERGVPVSGRRDLDGDGVAETSEEYVDGLLRTLRLDQDGDGNPEFTELYDPGVPGRSEQRWDYNSDGRQDSRQQNLPDGAVVREFSSRLDGGFDLRAVFRGGRLVEFRRGPRVVPVAYDSSRDLYRIGAVRDLGDLRAPLTEGIHQRGDKRLFVFEYQGKTYIGELE